jgi:multidrug efflux pump subunit AcrA (membrane-fusion protein)
LFARAQIVTRENDDGLAVPANALVTFAGLEKVVVVFEGKALEQIVTTGRRGDGWVEVSGGLKAGEKVVVEPGNLRTGDVVTVTEAGPMQTTRAVRDPDP